MQTSPPGRRRTRKPDLMLCRSGQAQRRPAAPSDHHAQRLYGQLLDAPSSLPPVEVNDDKLFSGCPANLEHGAPSGKVFNNWTQQTWPFLVSSGRQSNDKTIYQVEIENTSQGDDRDWLAIEWIELRFTASATKQHVIVALLLIHVLTNNATNRQGSPEWESLFPITRVPVIRTGRCIRPAGLPRSGWKSAPGRPPGCRQSPARRSSAARSPCG